MRGGALGRLRLPVLAGLLSMLVVGSTAALYLWALAGARRAEEARHHDVARRVFDAMEAELSDLVATEESRSFLEYRAYYVPQQSKLRNVVRSPLAEGGDSPLVKTYFQQDAEGNLSSPEQLRDNDAVWAAQEGFAPPQAADEKLRDLKKVLDQVEQSPREKAPWPSPSPVQQEQAPSSVDLLNSLGSARRTNRQAQAQKANPVNLEVYNNQGDLAEEQAQTAVLDLSRLADEDVLVSPLVGDRQGDDLVLTRQVHVDGATTTQGFVVDLDSMRQHLSDRVVGSTQLDQHLALSWDEGTPEGRWVFTHRFAPPFETVVLTAGVDPIPGVRGVEEGLLQGLAVLLVALLAVGGGALGWAVQAELAYARRRQDFVAAVSHELRTPLTSIRMYAEMLRDGMVPDPDRQHTYFATITSESERLSRLIGNVLELSRLEQGGPRPAPVVGDLGPLVEEAVATLSPHAAAQGVRFEVELPEGLPPVRLDRDGLLQVLVNLMDNAVKFGGEGMVGLTAEAVQGGVVLRVRDRGPGVPGGQLGSIFEPFYRGERELTRATKGTGIGLALVRQLVADMGGRVVARNHPEGGFEVVLRLVTP